MGFAGGAAEVAPDGKTVVAAVVGAEVDAAAAAVACGAAVVPTAVVPPLLVLSQPVASAPAQSPMRATCASRPDGVLLVMFVLSVAGSD